MNIRGKYSIWSITKHFRWEFWNLFKRNTHGMLIVISKNVSIDLPVEGILISDDRRWHVDLWIGRCCLSSRVSGVGWSSQIGRWITRFGRWIGYWSVVEKERTGRSGWYLEGTWCCRGECWRDTDHDVAKTWTARNTRAHPTLVNARPI